MRRDLPEGPGSPTPLTESSERPTLAAESFYTGDDIVALEAVGSTQRYEFTETLGEGGMGEVRLCNDLRIRRPVAMKVMRKERAAKPELRARFFREVLAQGQLEHPAIVPVYDVGTDERGDLYFTMRRVRGVTLEDILKGQRNKSADLVRDYSRHKLLTALGNACLAVHFAHTRGVFHCDLKPANVMLGDFGEVYVLDWGIAMRAGGALPTEPKISGDRPKDEASTSTVSGTPGYMAPEQIRGEALDARTDVYALGSVLFELLTLEPLHVGRNARALCLATLAGGIDRPSVRAPGRDVAPELEAICVKATALDPADRYPTARAFYDDLERYLEGDRDQSHRRAMSKEHARRAADAAKRVRAGGADAGEGRAEAMRAVSRALALDPDNADALRTLVQVLTDPPREMPAEAIEEMQAAERRFERARARAGGVSFLAWLAFLPVFFWLGIRSVPLLIGSTAAWLLAGAVLFYIERHPRPDGHAPTIVPIVASIAIATSSVIFGPLVLTPTFAAVFSLGFTLAMRPSRRFVPMIVGSLAVAVPVMLEWVNLAPASFIHLNGMLCIAPRMLNFPDHSTRVLLAPSVLCVVLACYFALGFRRVLTEMQRRVYVNAWQLRQLLPKEAGPASSQRDVANA